MKYVDFTNLSKVCPKDNYALSKINKLMDATIGRTVLSFMGAFSGYHQIPLHQEDQEKVASIIGRGIYCYEVMPFGLRTSGQVQLIKGL